MKTTKTKASTTTPKTKERLELDEAIRMLWTLAREDATPAEMRRAHDWLVAFFKRTATSSLASAIKSLAARVARYEAASGLARPRVTPTALPRRIAPPKDGVILDIERAERNVMRSLNRGATKEKASAASARVSVPSSRPRQPATQDGVVEAIERAARNTMRSIRK